MYVRSRGRARADLILGNVDVARFEVRIGHVWSSRLVVIQRQLDQSNLGITSIKLQGIDDAEIIETVRARRAPMIPVDASLPL